mmetsp:Transcript_21941/g.62485  ORF Transcript_21941/g.62485 Transcript_21941/m.62485 type:complete len:461 (-) Transcript_21941:7-1389(-)
MSTDHHERNEVLRRLYIATILCTCFLIVEAVGGWIAGSLAILSDAAHLFADVAGFAVAIAASYLAGLPATEQHTFGLKRSESLAALLSMISLAFASFGLAFEAIRRLMFGMEEPINAKLMTLIAAIGVVVNLILAYVLGEDHIHLPGSHDHDHSHDHGHGCSGHGSTHRSSGENDHHSHAHHNEAAAEACTHTEHDHGSHDHHHDHSPTVDTAAETHDHDHSHEDHAEPDCESHGHDHDDHHDHDHHHHDETDSLLKSNKSATEHYHSNEDEEHGAANAKSLVNGNVNLSAAYLHVLGDLAQSVAVLIAGLIVWWKPEWQILDPIITLLFSILVMMSTLKVLRTSVAVLLEETPPSISWQRVFDGIASIDGVANVHDLHIWSISHGEPALTVHCRSVNPDAMSEIYKVCKQFGISHATIQVQADDGECITCRNGIIDHHASGRDSMCSSGIITNGIIHDE